MLATMIRLAPLFLVVATPAVAAERTFAIASFDRIRVEGPYNVRLATGGTPMARASASADVLEALDIDVQGSLLVVRKRAAAGDLRSTARDVPTVITLRTPRLMSAMMSGGGSLAITGKIQAERVDMSLNGSGSLSATGIDAGQLVAVRIGTGSMMLGGRAAKVRLVTSGAGGIEAGGLLADDLNVRSDGTGATIAAARYTADIGASGIGSVTVRGSAACKVRASGGAPVTCGRPTQN